MKSFFKVFFASLFITIVLIAAFVFGCKTEQKTKQDTYKKEDNSVAEELEEDAVFSNFTKENFSKLLWKELEIACEQLGTIIAQDLSLKESIEVDLIYDPEFPYYGCHYRNKNLININLYRISKHENANLKLVDTLAHEFRHAFQSQRVKAGFTTKLELSYSNYINPQENYNQYYNQLAEVDARNYGSFWKNLVKSRLEA